MSAFNLVLYLKCKLIIEHQSNLQKVAINQFKVEYKQESINERNMRKNDPINIGQYDACEKTFVHPNYKWNNLFQLIIKCCILDAFCEQI